VISLAKIETWDNKMIGWLFDVWESISIRRGEVDLGALRRCMNCLSAGISWELPEGTVLIDGKLLCGRPGIVLIGLHSGAPILPVVHWGIEDFIKISTPETDGFPHPGGETIHSGCEGGDGERQDSPGNGR